MDKVVLGSGTVPGAVVAASVYGLVTATGDRTSLWWAFGISLTATVALYAVYVIFFQGTGSKARKNSGTLAGAVIKNNKVDGPGTLIRIGGSQDESPRDVWLALSPSMDFQRLEIAVLSKTGNVAGHVQVGIALKNTAPFPVKFQVQRIAWAVKDAAPLKSWSFDNRGSTLASGERITFWCPEVSLNANA